MKKALLTLLTVCIALTTTAQQQGINYKALIKDASGNVLASTFMNVQFTIHATSATGTIVYQENHASYTTTANGMIILNIGTGTPAVGTFNTIDWAADIHFLNTTISYSGGSNIDLGTTQFMAVPYAKQAETATHAITSGDTKWTEGTTANDITNNNTGTVEIAGTLQIQGTANIDAFSIDGTFANNSDTAIPTEKAVKTYVDSNLATGLEALDQGNGIGWRLKGRDPNNYGNIGFNAVDLSYSSSASTTKGATGDSSTAMGRYTTASGNNSTAMGVGTTTSGNYSSAMGDHTKAEAISSTAIGSYNIGGGDATTWVATDPLFEIGNSKLGSPRSNALTVLKNGNTEINGNLTVTGTNNLTSGLEALDQGNSIGWRLKGRNPNNYGNIGLNAIDLSSNNSASTTKGATGDYSTAMGDSTTASGENSTAMGYATTASGTLSTAMGYYTTAPSFAETAIGSYNTFYTPLEVTNWDSSDRLFVIGNGFFDSITDVLIRSNALTVYKNGTSKFTAKGSTDIDIIVGGTSNSTTGDDGLISSNPDYLGSDLFLRSYDAVVVRLDYDNNETGNFQIKNGAGSVVFDVNESGTVRVNGSIVHSSDRRLKKDIETLPYGLKEILQLQPKAYNWKSHEQTNKSLGLIAQEVQPIIKEVVTTQDDEQKTLGISYTELIPVLINAIKEQDEVIKGLQSTVTSQKEDFSALLARIEQLEQKNTKNSEKEMVSSE